MLGTMHVLKAAAAASSYSKRVVFLVLAGEPWGYMGSRRLLYEAAAGSNATEGLNLELVEKVRRPGVFDSVACICMWRECKWCVAAQGPGASAVYSA